MAQQRIILDRYAQIERLGSGATGTVDLCWDARIRRYVAIKRMPLSSTTPGAQVPGLAEARMAAALNHPNIVSVYDFEAADGEALLIMEAIEGPALSDILDETPPGQLDRDIIASIANSVASALSFAHSNNVLHLDVKPDNILVDLEGRWQTRAGLPFLRAAPSATCPPSNCAPKSSTSAATCLRSAWSSTRCSWVKTPSWPTP